MPKEIFTKDYPFMSSDEWLSFDQMFTMCRAFTQLGVEKIRLTGGEPLLRKGLEALIARLATLDTDLALTTNGSLLAARAHALKQAGLRRVTVSLDAIDDDLFARMNGVGFPVARVLEGIDAAIDAGLAPLKINVVVEKGVNESQILPLARHFHRRPVDLRFIEYMDVGGAHGWSQDKIVHSDRILALLQRHFSLEADSGADIGSTSVNYRFTDGLARVGFVSSMSHPFCSTCSRARVSADGQLFSCLFATQSFDLKPWLDASITSDELIDVVRAQWTQRDDRYSELRGTKPPQDTRKRYPTVRMSLVGG
ncbi:GTP cyclohydrolase subunit MoaA [Caballeronia peredens]|nr:GTP cyclohydrolase subunit MoaA [Caballeronia peredens]